MEWTYRTIKIANVIPCDSVVIDLGGGMENLRKYLRGNYSYRSIDIKPWTDETIVADFNKGELPEIDPAQIVVVQGLLEYIHDSNKFLKSIKKYGGNLILTYRMGTIGVKGRSNSFSFDDIRRILGYAGWIIQFEKIIGSSEMMFYCARDILLIKK
jgi:hypothetical protein